MQTHEQTILVTSGGTGVSPVSSSYCCSWNREQHWRDASATQGFFYFFFALVTAVFLGSTVGCGPNVDEANQKVADLAERGQSLLDEDRLDDAAAAADEASAVEGATERQPVRALREAIQTRRHHEMVADSAAMGLKYWAEYDVGQLTDFQETGRRPKTLWPEAWGPPIRTAGLKERWRSTVEQTLPEALARAEKHASWAAAPKTTAPPEPDDGSILATPEQIEADPDAWYSKQVRIENVRIGRIVRDAEHGCLVTITTSDGTTFPAHVRGTNLVFAAYRDVAYWLEHSSSNVQDASATLYCTVKRGKVMALSGLKHYPRALIHKITLSGS
ncbi:MAG: hypothetical protein JW818_22290 [Pirellulales bacterium]|nr:hypothetical protein [Pirellulales bacterium]